MEMDSNCWKLKLYNISLKTVISNHDQLKSRYDILPDTIFFDCFHLAVQFHPKHVMLADLTDLDTFGRLLNVMRKRDHLHDIFKNGQNAIFEKLFRDKEEDRECPVPNCMPRPSDLSHKLIGFKLAKEFERRCEQNPFDVSLCYIGLDLGSFLLEAHYYKESAMILKWTLKFLLEHKNAIARTTACFQRLILAQSMYFNLEDAKESRAKALEFLERISYDVGIIGLSGIYFSFAHLSFNEANFDEASKWLSKCMKEMDDYCTPQLIIDIFRFGSKYCVSRKEFRKAELLATEAITYALRFYGEGSSAFSDALNSFAFFLLNQDSVKQAVRVYAKSMGLRLMHFGLYNIATANHLEDMAYANYVKEYNSGSFFHAELSIEKAIESYSLLVPKDHLLVASSRRVQALILEEKALDIQPSPTRDFLIRQAESLHLNALSITLKAFGEMNVQTARHYGNLGRLYQTMKQFEKAEEMHLRAIQIKETILGEFDYEVALSVGHLASLYNYDLMLYHKAEPLHLRSIEIGRKLYGEAFTGLEYDYRGLIQIYQINGEAEKLEKYTIIFENWRRLKEKKLLQNKSAIQYGRNLRDISEIVEDFFSD